MRFVHGFAIGVLALSASSGLTGCGDDRAERGLTPPGEVAAPFEEAEASKTEAERDRENLAKEERAEE